MKIALISHLKYPLKKPFAGGLEAFVYRFVFAMRDRGHEVTVFASGKSDPELKVFPILPNGSIAMSRNIEANRRESWIRSEENRAFRRCLDFIDGGSFDLVYNNSLSPIPIEHLSRSAIPSVTTLHAPPISPIREMAKSIKFWRNHSFINISKANSQTWKRYIGEHQHIHNGVPIKEPGSHKNGRLVWFGRIHPDKGLEHALEAASIANKPLDIAGPISDANYFEARILPEIRTCDRYLGHLNPVELAKLLKKSSVCLVTPKWEEPFGLVIAEALSFGTPVAAFNRGAIPEILDNSCGRITTRNSSEDLAKAALEAFELSPASCIKRVADHFSFDAMLDAYENLFRQKIANAESVATFDTYRKASL